MRSTLSALALLLVATSPSAIAQGVGNTPPMEAERVRVDGFNPNLHFSACSSGCYDVRYDRNRVTVLRVDAHGRAQVLGSYVPRWGESDAMPGNGAVAREILISQPLPSAQANGDSYCGADGWGYQFSELISTTPVTGGAICSQLYIGVGQLQLVCIYPNGDGNMQIEPAPIRLSASNSNSCQNLRAQAAPARFRR